MNLSQWLEATREDRPVFSFVSDGTVIAYIHGKRYVYQTDAGYHERWKLISRYAPWKVLNWVKEAGELIESPPKSKSQKFLF
jgi:hypothetical protein